MERFADTKGLQDQPYLVPIIEQIKAESKEREALDTMTIVKNH